MQTECLSGITEVLSSFITASLMTSASTTARCQLMRLNGFTIWEDRINSPNYLIHLISNKMANDKNRKYDLEERSA